jgi:hypothetical protein
MSTAAQPICVTLMTDELHDRIVPVHMMSEKFV